MTEATMTCRATPVGTTTVVIMSHNYGRYLGQSIKSVLTQTIRAARVIVVDDASDDDTYSAVLPYLPEVEYHRVEFRSQQKTRNFGLALATTEFVLFLDADDYMVERMLERLEDSLQSHPEARLAYCDKYVFGDTDAMQRLNLASHWRAGSFSLATLRFKNFVMATSLVRRRFLTSFDERIVRLTDWDTWLAILHEDAHAVYVPEPLLHYRVHGENVSFRRRELIERLKILVKHGLIRANGFAADRAGSSAGANLRSVVILAMGASRAEVVPWRELAHTHGWKVRVIVGLLKEGTDAERKRDTIVRAGAVVLQTTTSPDIEDLLRRYSGVITNTRVDAVIVAADPCGVPDVAASYGDARHALICDRSPAEIMSTKSLEELGTFALSPAAARLLLYLPPAARPTAIARLRHAAAELVSQHIGWRFRRQASTGRRHGN